MSAIPIGSPVSQTGCIIFDPGVDYLANPLGSLTGINVVLGLESEFEDSEWGTARVSERVSEHSFQRSWADKVAAIFTSSIWQIDCQFRGRDLGVPDLPIE